jgi:DNA-binding NarL/FixJ family response regulator
VALVNHGRAQVIIAEDDVLMGEGLASLLEQGGYKVVGQAGDGSELMRLVRERRPELVVVDISACLQLTERRGSRRRA